MGEPVRETQSVEAIAKGTARSNGDLETKWRKSPREGLSAVLDAGTIYVSKWFADTLTLIEIYLIS